MKQNNIMDSILLMVGQINSAFSELDETLLFFKPSHQRLRFDITKEAAWLNNVDFYYGLFFERCDVWWDFVLQKDMTYGGNYECMQEGKEILHDLRTYKSHSLDANKQQNREIMDNAERWYYGVVGSKCYNETNVYLCSVECNKIVYDILTEIEKCVDSFLSDARRDRIVNELLRIRECYYPDYQIVKMLGYCIEKYELKYLNVQELAQKYGRKIREKAKLYCSADIETLDRQISLFIEEILFSEKIGICPLSGERIMEIYKIGPGELLGEIKRKAIDIAHEYLYISEQELLKKLMEFYPFEQESVF